MIIRRVPSLSRPPTISYFKSPFFEDPMCLFEGAFQYKKVVKLPFYNSSQERVLICFVVMQVFEHIDDLLHIYMAGLTANRQYMYLRCK
jgi:hypothetical protein